MKHEYRKTIPFVPLGYLLATLIFFYLMLAAGSGAENRTQQIVGIIITFFAYMPWIFARWELGNAYTVRPSARTLVKSGIYRYIQHPLYVSQTLVILGVCLFVGNLYLTVIATLGYMALSIYRGREEHKILRAAFGEEYQAYADKTWL